MAIAYGYNQLQEATPQTVTAGRELPLNQLVELLRGECAAAGQSISCLRASPVSPVLQGAFLCLCNGEGGVHSSMSGASYVPFQHSCDTLQ